jgi:hypothetical protein
VSGRTKGPGKAPGKARTGSHPAPVDLGAERRARALVAQLRAVLDAGEVDTTRTAEMLSGDLETARMDLESPTTLRLPRALLDRAEAVAAALPAHPSRSAVLRRAVEMGIAALEAEATAAALPPDLASDVAALRRRVERLEGHAEGEDARLHGGAMGRAAVPLLGEWVRGGLSKEGYARLCEAFVADGYDRGEAVRLCALHAAWHAEAVRLYGSPVEVPRE